MENITIIVDMANIDVYFKTCFGNDPLRFYVRHAFICIGIFKISIFHDNSRSRTVYLQSFEEEPFAINGENPVKIFVFINLN